MWKVSKLNLKCYFAAELAVSTSALLYVFGGGGGEMARTAKKYGLWLRPFCTPFAKLGVCSVSSRGGPTAPPGRSPAPSILGGMEERSWGRTDSRGGLWTDRQTERRERSSDDLHGLSAQGADLYPQTAAGTLKK